MWTNQCEIETDAAPEAIWRLWADVSGWPAWNGDIERIELIGPFAAGGRIRMTPIGGDPIELLVADAIEPEFFVDEARLDGVVVRTIHRVQRLDCGRNRITYRLELSGSAADTIGPELGGRISADFPQTLAALAARAEG